MRSELFLRQNVAMPLVALASAESALARSADGFERIALVRNDDSDTAKVTVESASGMCLADIELEWRDLIARSLEPNVFMDPAVIDSAQRNLNGRNCMTLLAWQHGHGAAKLIGLWALSVGRPEHSLLPFRALRAPAVPHGYLATPVVDRDEAATALAAMLDFLARDHDLPALIALDAAAMSGPTMHVLTHALETRGQALLVLAQVQRPMLVSQLDAKQYFEKALSASSRKKLRQHRRRLAERGTLESKVWNKPDEVSQAFEDFLALEAAGWKGRRGSALLCHPDEAAFARAMMETLAKRGHAWVHGLALDSRPVSMQVVLRAGAVAFTWKTAYDEAMHDVSPGMLLLEDYTAAFLADDTITRVDSCAYDETGFMSSWSERETVAQVWIATRPGQSLRFFLLAHLQKTYLATRAKAKEMHLRWRRRWKTH
jgi:CelD/BcsL family acetyltransferase involved in cellulose biosynthesis